MQKGGLNRTIIQEALGQPTIEETKDKIPEDPQEAQRIKTKTTKYVLIVGQLYRQDFSFPLLQRLGETKAERAIKEVYERACGSHIGGRALASKIAYRHQAPPKPLHSGVDILGYFPLAVGQVKFLLVIVDYFTKWIKVESVATILAERERGDFIGKKLCCFGILAIIVSDNGTQIVSRAVVQFCVEYGIKQSTPKATDRQKPPIGLFSKDCINSLKRRREDGYFGPITPHRTQLPKETAFHLTFGTDAMIPIEGKSGHHA
ncbi:hypothetical protein CR513_59786, partial [Mucuna pruriens]